MHVILDPLISGKLQRTMAAIALPTNTTTHFTKYWITGRDIHNHRKYTLTMAERNLQDLLRKLKSTTASYTELSALLSQAKIALLHLKTLTPQATTSSSILLLAREIFEQGALISIRAKDPAAFTRYVNQLLPFYELPAERLPPTPSAKNKITGLSLLLLLTQGNYAGFHTELEGLELRGGRDGKVEDDKFLGYPIKLERWLMEGSYDLVWKAMASKEVPSPEYGVFSEASSSIP